VKAGGRSDGSPEIEAGAAGYHRGMGWTAPEVSRPSDLKGCARAVGAVLLGSAVWMMAAASPPSLGASTSASVTQGSLRLTPSASPKAGSPLTITESGQIGLTSTLKVFAQLGRPCAAGQSAEAASGALEIDQRVIPGSSAPFSVTSVFTPAAAGSYFVCGYLDGASGGSEVSEAASVVVVVAPGFPPPSTAPSPGPGAGPMPGGLGSPARGCVVPALGRHSLAGARHLLGVAGCSLGLILQPSAGGISKARQKPGGRSLVLVVGSQFPAAGTRLGPNKYVAIRLVLGRAPASRAKTGAK